MKKKWSNFFFTIFFLFSIFLNQSLSAKECLNFEGEWVGTCSNDNFIELKIKQPSCEIINIKGENLPIGKGYIGSTKNVSGQVIERKKMASFSPKKNKLTISSMLTITNAPNLFHVDILKKSLMKKDQDTLIYTIIGKKVQTSETKIIHSDYSWSCFLSKSN